MGFLIIAIAATYAIKYALDKGKAEYGYTRDKRADEFARANPDWSPGRVRRHAKRAARGYWWDQIRNGFPEARSAYRENRDLAEATRVEAETAGMRRRAEVRARIRKALEEADRIRTEERDRFYGDDEPLPDGPKAGEAPKPASPASEPEPTPEKPEAAADGDKPVDETTPKPTPVEEKPEDLPQDTDADTDGAEVFPFKRPAPERDDEPTTGDTPEMTDTNPYQQAQTTVSGEVHGGYEQILAGYNADVERLEGNDAIYEQQIAAQEQLIQNLQDADAGYEQRMSGLRSMNADDNTVANDAYTREANENGLNAANVTLESIASQREANRIQLSAATAARDNWQERHGAVYDAKTSTGAAGDEALYR
ncbi:MAG: hypothetical protein JWO67_3990 [Streptosporangiaceae bacterium]|nr:hypothetical protein [Streptosporangiaceae bacterium]